MELTVEQLKAKMDANEAFLFLDVRGVDEYAEYNMGALNIPLHVLEARINELDEYKNKEIIVHCKMGGRSFQAQQFLLGRGFTKVYNLTGGAMAYQAKFG